MNGSIGSTHPSAPAREAARHAHSIKSTYGLNPITGCGNGSPLVFDRQPADKLIIRTAAQRTYGIAHRGWHRPAQGLAPEKLHPELCKRRSVIVAGRNHGFGIARQHAWSRQLAVRNLWWLSTGRQIQAIGLRPFMAIGSLPRNHCRRLAHEDPGKPQRPDWRTRRQLRSDSENCLGLGSCRPQPAYGY